MAMASSAAPPRPSSTRMRRTTTTTTTTATAATTATMPTPEMRARRASHRRSRHKLALPLSTESSPSATSTASSSDRDLGGSGGPQTEGGELELELTLDDFVRDSHLHSIFLQYLSTNDKKSFARLLFLVSVEEFKNLLNTRVSVGTDEERSHPEFAEESKELQQYHRSAYASKIIAKFMSQDSFLDIASENLKILNKSVWSFGSFLRNDLMMCAALSSKMDLFNDAEIAVRKALQPSFEKFARTKAYRDLLTNARISYAFIGGEDESSHGASAFGEEAASSQLSSSASPSPSRVSSYLTLQRVLSNRRLCSVFWIFLFKEGAHQQLSLWMDLRFQLLPILESFIAAADAESDAGNMGPVDGNHAGNHAEEAEQQHPGDLIEQILVTGTKICEKYLAVDASSSVKFVADQDQELLYEYERHVTNCMDTGSFSIADAEAMVRTMQKIATAIEYNLQVNDFVRFMGSDSFKSLVSSYQSRLLSPAGSMRPGAESREDVLSASASSDCSVTTLQELFHCMNVPSHLPQRIPSKHFNLKELLQSQIRGESSRSSLISSILTFRLDATNKESPIVVKDFLHTLAKNSDSRHHHTLPDHVESFFCPSGAEVIRSRTRPEPKLFHMTIGNADKSFYGACLTRYVPQVDDSQLGPLEIVLRETEGLEVYIPVGLCIISRYPILDTLKKRLEDLHVQMQDDEGYQSDASWRPSGFQMEELLAPFDFSGVVNGSFSALDDYVDFSMEELFLCLSIENVVSLVNCMLLERQIVLVSSRYSVLTCVGETLKCLMGPLEWSHVFAPILPRSMLEVLQCPTPYLFGVHSSYRDDLDEMLYREGSCEQIVVVDLDANTMSSQVRAPMPEHLGAPLIAQLQQLLQPRVYFSDFVSSSPSKSPTTQRFPETRVRECFRMAVTQLLQPFEEYRFVLSDDFDFVVVFDRNEFLRRVPLDELSFYRSFLETQVFSHHIASVA